MDVIKTRLQIQHHDSTLDNTQDKSWIKTTEKISGEYKMEESETLRDAHYSDIRDVAKKIYKSEGMHGFYKGFFPRMLFVAPGVAISWGTYEFFKSILKADSQ